MWKCGWILVLAACLQLLALSAASNGESRSGRRQSTRGSRASAQPRTQSRRQRIMNRLRWPDGEEEKKPEEKPKEDEEARKQRLERETKDLLRKPPNQHEDEKRPHRGVREHIRDAAGKAQSTVEAMAANIGATVTVTIIVHFTTHKEGNRSYSIKFSHVTQDTKLKDGFDSLHSDLKSETGYTVAFSEDTYTVKSDSVPDYEHQYRFDEDCNIGRLSKMGRLTDITVHINATVKNRGPYQ